jgi:DNA-binding CsgD family transcriptional regulator
VVLRDLLYTGLSMRQIAVRLDKSYEAIASKAQRVYKRVGVTSRVELMALEIRRLKMMIPR